MQYSILCVFLASAMNCNANGMHPHSGEYPENRKELLQRTYDAYIELMERHKKSNVKESFADWMVDQSEADQLNHNHFHEIRGHKIYVFDFAARKKRKQMNACTRLANDFCTIL